MLRPLNSPAALNANKESTTVELLRSDVLHAASDHMQSSVMLPLLAVRLPLVLLAQAVQWVNTLPPLLKLF